MRTDIAYRHSAVREQFMQPVPSAANSISLLNMSRMAVRKQLQKVAPHQNLRMMFTDLGLPSILNAYMLFSEPYDG